ncbi:hypothetical protein Tco_0976628 [Tanacetum coccineum]|uniref:Hexosyltransferase n=1 Tax=Tanacetum coccineum TaxID=301880 RepID=A0ABQ5EHV5_9ASTR
MLFYLTSMHVSYVLTDYEPTDPYLVDGENVSTKAQMADYEKAVSQWNHNEYNCRNYILNALDDSLYDIYSTFATARSVGNLGTKLRIVATRKSMEAEILEEISIKQTMWNLQKSLLELLNPS